MENLNCSNNSIFEELEMDLNLFNDSFSSDFDDEETDQTYKVSHNDLKELRSDEKEDVSTAQEKKVYCYYVLEIL